MTDQIPILGVDYSGAKADKNTWATLGILTGDVLTLESCQATPRAELAVLLASLPGIAVGALDFPFSGREEFAQEWRPGAKSLPDLLRTAAAMD